MQCPRCQADNPETSRFCAGCGTRLTALHGEAPEETRTLPPLLDLSTGSLFAGRYQVIEKLGAGGMGRVYKVFDTKVKEKIALKLIRPEIASDEKTIERFEHELRATRRIAHRNVCRMFDLGEDGGTYYITMEFVPGETLRSIIRMTGPLSIGTAVNYASQVAEGLAEAHRFDVVHRDLKPQNILIDPSGTARIMDFGIARSVQAKDWTAEGFVVGTPEYMSPEQAEGEDTDVRSDIYSLGVVLYEMVTGKVPFEGKTPLSVIMKHKTAIPAPPRKINPLIPERLERLILKCLEKDRTRRFQTAAEMRAELGNIGADLPTPISQPAAAKTPFVGRRPAVRYALLGLVILAAVAVVYLLVRKPWPSPARPPAPAAGGRASWTNSIVVLPFRDVSRGQSRADLAAALSEGIRTKLAGIEGLKVISRYSSDQSRALAKTTTDLGRILEVNNILDGTFEMAEDAVRVEVELTETKGGMIVWTQGYTEKPDRTFYDIEIRIAADIATKLRLRYTGEAIGSGRATEPANLEALDSISRAKAAEYRYRDLHRNEDFKAGVRFYESAIALDPNYAQANRGLGNLYEAKYAFEGNRDDYIAMIRNFESAFAKNSTIAETHAGMGWVYFYRNDFDNAYRSFKAAFDIAPNDSEINYNVGSFLRSIGLDTKAVEYYTRALVLDPRSLYAFQSCAASYWNLGQFDAGLGKIEQALAIDPTSYRFHASYARFLVATRNLEKAEEEIRLIEKIMPKDEDARDRLTRLTVWLLALRGEKDKALALLNAKEIKQPYRYEITNAFIVLGRTDEALKNITWGMRDGFNLIKDFLYPYPYFLNNPYFEGLRSNPRFQEIMAEAKAAHEAKLKKYSGL